MFETLEVSVHDNIAKLWLNRPERLNALSLQVLAELAEAAHWLDQQTEVKVVIVGGHGRAFSAGADLQGFPEVQEQGARAAADAGRKMADAIEGMQAVSIAQIQGWCVGGGLVLAAACDLRVATTNARFSIPEVDLGIPLAWGGIPRLVRDIGPAATRDLVMTCREFGPDEAKSLGFLNRVVNEAQLDGEVSELAATLAAKPTMPIAATKTHVNAVASQMVGMARSWSDADGLLGGLTDPECQAARAAYLKARIK
ncbi:MAG: enoyl-CoA hydratase/isomerase family protein [Pseudomonadota bacterium]